MDSLEDNLHHDGIKGMRWGVVNWRTPGGKDDKSKAKADKKERSKLIKKDQDWKKKAEENTIAIYNKAADESSKIADSINTKYEKKYGKDFALKFDDEQYSKYKKEYTDAFAIELSKQIELSPLSKSPSGDYSLTVTVSSDTGLPSWKIEPVKDKLKHSVIDLIMVANGDIIDDDLLQHDGVKGMKWGVVRWRKPGGKSGKPRAPGRMKQEWDSAKRERHWQRTLNSIDNLSTKQISSVSKRLSAENEFKKLSKSATANAKDKKDYRLREKMSDQELNRKVTRLRVKSGLQKQVSTATEQQRAIGKRIVSTGGSIFLNYAMNKNVSAGDIFESVVNPNAAKTKVTKLVIDSVVTKYKNTKHSDDLEDVLLHFGVPGMKWGVRRRQAKVAKRDRRKATKDISNRLKSGQISKTQAKTLKTQAYHKQRSVNKTYRTEYNNGIKKGLTPKKAMAVANKHLRAEKTVNAYALANAAIVTVSALRIAQIATSRPDGIMKRKNVVEAMKRSPLRYVDGKKIKDFMDI